MSAAFTTKSKSTISKALRKYGRDQFEVKILQTYGTSEEALNAEDGWIEKMQSRVTQHGYNVRKGGRFGKVTCPETLRNMSLVREGKTLEHKKIIVEKVIELNAQGLTNAQISELVGRVPTQVKAYLDHLSIPSHGRPGRDKQTKEKEIGAEVIRLREMGWSYRQIEKEIGSSRRTITRIYQDYINWKSETPELPWDIRKYGAKVVDLRSQGLTWDQVCTEIGCSESTAIKLFNQMTGKVPRTKAQVHEEIQRKCKIVKWLKSEGFFNRDIVILLGLGSVNNVCRYTK